MLETPQAMSDTALKRFREMWQQNYGGLANSGKTAILENGMKWQAIGMRPADAEFIASRKFQVTEIARIFRVALERLGVRPEEAVHVGNEEADRLGALAAGLAFEPVPLATLPDRLGLQPEAEPSR